MSNQSTFDSPLGEHINHFLIHHRALGKCYDTEESALRLLERFVFQQVGSVTLETLTSADMESFLQSRARASDRSHNHLLSVIQRFFRWLVNQRVLSSSPVTAQSRRVRQRQIPFLFQRQQVERLLELASELPDAQPGYRRGVTYRMIYVLMYGVGLRVREVSRLCHQDFDTRLQCLHIRQTKFGKSRLVPLGPNMAAALTQFLTNSTVTAPLPGDPLFSLSKDGRQPIGSHAISTTFTRIVDQLELRVPAGTMKPRLHCLRHSFAVSTLTRWYQAGMDPAEMLMHLSVFLGHVNPASTATYLTITAELFDLANQRIRVFAAPVLREARL